MDFVLEEDFGPLPGKVDANIVHLSSNEEETFEDVEQT